MTKRKLLAAQNAYRAAVRIFDRFFPHRETVEETALRIRQSIERDNLANIRYERRFIPSPRTRAEVIDRG